DGAVGDYPRGVGHPSVGGARVIGPSVVDDASVVDDPRLRDAIAVDIAPLARGWCLVDVGDPVAVPVQRPVVISWNAHVRVPSTRGLTGSRDRVRGPGTCADGHPGGTRRTLRLRGLCR